MTAPHVPTDQDAPNETTFVHPDFGYSLPLPTAWDTRVLDDQGGTLVSTETGAPDGLLRTTIVMTVDEHDPDATLDDWQLEVEHQLTGVLNDFLLIDRRPARLGGTDAVLRVVSYATPDRQPATLTQWAAQSEGRGYTLSCTVHSLAYHRAAAWFDDVAARLTLPAPEEAR